MSIIPRFGLFCDGTGNNMFNAMRDPADADEPTNIAKLYQLYQAAPGVSGKHYEAGVGTARGRANNPLLMGFALDFEIRLQNVLRAVRRFGRGFPAGSEVTVDVFGFSRGAALGRAFINEAQRLRKVMPEFWGEVAVRVGFVGLFDTVASIGLPGDDHHGRFNLDLDPDLIEYCYHLTARHEKRAYFPLHSILKGPDLPVPANFKEEELPGAHSDIGGGYGPVADVVHFPPFLVHWRKVGEKIRQVEAMLARYHADYSSTLTANMRIEVHEVECIEVDVGTRLRQSTFTASWTRHVDNSLAHVALAKMHRRALVHGLPFPDGLAALARKDLAYDIEPELTELIARLDSDPTAEAELYRQYIHHSHQFAAAPGVPINANLPTRGPGRAAAMGRREIFYNDPANAYGPADEWRLRPEFALLGLPDGYQHEGWERITPG